MKKIAKKSEQADSGGQNQQNYGRGEVDALQVIRKESSPLLPEDKEHRQKDKKHDHSIPDPVHQHGSKHFVKAGQPLSVPVLCRVTGDNSAAGDFSSAGDYHIDDIADIHRIKRCKAGCGRIYRQQSLPPPAAPDPEGVHAYQHGQNHKLPGTPGKSCIENLPVYAAEREPQQHCRKRCGQNVFDNI